MLIFPLRFQNKTDIHQHCIYLCLKIIKLQVNYSRPLSWKYIHESNQKFLYFCWYNVLVKTDQETVYEIQLKNCKLF